VTTFLWAIGVFPFVNAFRVSGARGPGATAVDRLLAITSLDPDAHAFCACSLHLRADALRRCGARVRLLNFIVTLAAGRLVETGKSRVDWA